MPRSITDANDAVLADYPVVNIPLTSLRFHFKMATRYVPRARRQRRVFCVTKRESGKYLRMGEIYDGRRAAAPVGRR